MRKLLIIFIFISITLIGVKFDEKIDLKYIDTINYLTEKDIIKGFPDGTFKVNWAITQSEFITMIVRCNIKYAILENKKTFLDNIKSLISNLLRTIIKKDDKVKFKDFQNEWFHPYLLEYLNITNINEEEIEPLLYINIYEALYFILKASKFKGEVENFNLPLDDKEKREVLISAVSHKFYPYGLPFKNRLSRGDAFILIENYLRKVEDAIDN